MEGIAVAIMLLVVYIGLNEFGVTAVIDEFFWHYGFNRAEGMGFVPSVKLAARCAMEGRTW
jgi:hypothetical protein